MVFRGTNLIFGDQKLGDLINIGTGVETSIRELAETLQKLTQFDGRVWYNTDRFVGVKRKVLNISKAQKTYGWTINNQMTSLELGLQKTINWYKKTYLGE